MGAFDHAAARTSEAFLKKENNPVLWEIRIEPDFFGWFTLVTIMGAWYNKKMEE